ncbi:MAG: type III pantothenate kinase [Epsilonproteobacteria bacterium]|nr:type III pantothenate kinase [Campylobacterota bacterium]
MILADFGNSRAHLYLDNNLIIHISYERLYKEFANKEIYYICVNRKEYPRIKSIKKWIELSPYIKINGEYEGMGVDRKALLLSRGDGLYIDAGSAITIDYIKANRYEGGVIIAGFKRQLEALKSLSLELKRFKAIDKPLQKSTEAQIVSGLISPIISLINSFNEDRIYITGGDGRAIANYLNNAIYEEALIFEGLKKVLKDISC